MSTTTPTPFAETAYPDTMQPETTQPETTQQPETIAAGPTAHGCCGRRTVLRAAGLVALSGGAIAVAGCSADSPAATPTTANTPATPTTANTPSGTESSAAASPSETESASGKSESQTTPAGTPVAISQVAVGGGVIVDEKYVVTQPSAGEFKAFSAICTHQGCVVGSVADRMIVCPCHGSHFDISTGDPVSGPAQEPLPALEVTESGDNLYVG